MRPAWLLCSDTVWVDDGGLCPLRAFEREEDARAALEALGEPWDGELYRVVPIALYGPAETVDLAAEEAPGGGPR